MGNGQGRSVGRLRRWCLVSGSTTSSPRSAPMLSFGARTRSAAGCVGRSGVGVGTAHRPSRRAGRPCVLGPSRVWREHRWDRARRLQRRRCERAIPPVFRCVTSSRCRCSRGASGEGLCSSPQQPLEQVRPSIRYSRARRRPRIDDLSASSMSSERRTKASSTECASGRCELCDGGCWAGRCAGSAETRGMSSCWRSVRRRCGESPVGYGGRVHGILHGDRHGVAVHQCGRMIAASFRLLLAGVRDARCARAHCMSSQQPAMPKRGLFWLGSVGRRVNWRRWSHPVSVSKTPGLKLVCLRRGLAGWRARRIPVAVML